MAGQESVAALEQAPLTHRGESLATHDQVIVELDTQEFAGSLDSACELEVFGRRIQASGRVVVREDEAESEVLDSGLQDLTGVSPGGVQGSYRDSFLVDHAVLGVEVQADKVLLLEGSDPAYLLEDVGRPTQDRPFAVARVCPARYLEHGVESLC